MFFLYSTEVVVAMSVDNIDIELFIQLIQERDVIWDKTLESYKDKRKTLKAWHEICQILIENFDTMSAAAKNKQGKAFVQKWKNMRDVWTRCHTKMTNYKSGSGAQPVHKYTYYDNMNFLIKIANHNNTESNMSSQGEAKSAIPPKKKKIDTPSNVDSRMLQFIDKLEKEENESRIMSFFKGISPTVDKFSDDDIVEFQYQVMSIIRDIKQKNVPVQSMPRTQSAVDDGGCNSQSFINSTAKTTRRPDLGISNDEHVTREILNDGHVMPVQSTLYQYRTENTPSYDADDDLQDNRHYIAQRPRSQLSNHSSSTEQQSFNVSSQSEYEYELDFTML